MADDDLDILAWTMLGEAGGEGMQGMADVGHVVLNRVNNGRYGASIQDVALAPKQFSTWNSGSGGNNPKSRYPKDSPEFKRAREIASQVVAGTIPGPPGRPLDYNAPSVNPYWADSKAKHGTYTRNGHVFYPSVPVPPGELPEVATALSTVPTPRNAPAPVTPSIDMAQMRRISAPSQLIPDTFARLPSSTRSLGDEIAMSPIQGGRQQAPMFDAAYDERTGTMRLTREPIDSQGIAVGRSSEPAPIPAVQSPQLAAKRATDPVLQAALNAKYPAQLPPLPAPAQPRPQVSGAMSYAGQDRATLPSPPVNVAAYSTLGRGSSVPEEYRYNTGLIGGPRINPSAPDRLTAGAPGMGIPGMSGISPQQVAQIGLDVNGKAAPLPYQRPAGLGTSPVQVAKVAPIPFMRPDFPQVATALDVVPMPPLPIPRPKVAPIPFDRPNFGIGGPGFANLFGIKLPSIPRQLQTVAGRTSAFEPAMRQVMTGSPNLRTLTSAVAAQRGPGMSAQQAYDRANSASVERAIAGASNSDAAQRLNERLGNI